MGDGSAIGVSSSSSSFLKLSSIVNGTSPSSKESSEMTLKHDCNKSENQNISFKLEIIESKKKQLLVFFI